MKIYQISSNRCHKQALKVILANHLDCQPDRAIIQTNPNGKPWHPEIHFSLSHSQNRALIAVDHNRPVGVDLEAHRPVRNMVKIARRFGFSSHEPQAFFDHWTIREALIKAQGLKLLRNPGPIGWTLQKLDLGSGWSAHLAFQGAQDPLETFHVQDFPSELLDR